MDIAEVHKLIDQYLRKTQNVYLPPEEKDRVLNRAQVDVFESYKKLYGINEQVHDALLPFKSEYSFSNGTSVSGLITFPSNYVHLLSVETVVVDSDGTKYIPVEPVGEDELSYRRSSQLIPLNVYNPIGMLKAGRTFQIYPMQATAGTAYYLRKPLDCKFAYTIVNNRPVYDSGNSVQLEWNEQSTNEIINKALEMLSIQTQDSSVTQATIAKEGAGGNN